MKVRIAVLLAALGALATGSVAAALDSPPSVLGMVVGEPLSLPACADDGADSLNRCVMAVPSRPLAPIIDLSDEDGVSFPWLQGVAIILRADRTIDAIRLGTRGVDGQTAAYTAIVDKFGQPDSREVHEVHNAMNARWEIISAFWNRGSYVVRFTGAVDDDLTFGRIIISTPEYLSNLENQERQRPSL